MKPYTTGGTPLSEIFIAQKGKCFLCDKHMHIQQYSEIYKNGWTKEHLVPKSYLRKNGIRVKYNTVLTHKKCNAIKADRFPTKMEVIKFKKVYKKILNF